MKHQYCHCVNWKEMNFTPFLLNPYYICVLHIHHLKLGLGYDYKINDEIARSGWSLDGTGEELWLTYLPLLSHLNKNCCWHKLNDSQIHLIHSFLLFLIVSYCFLCISLNDTCKAILKYFCAFGIRKTTKILWLDLQSLKIVSDFQKKCYKRWEWN